MGVMPLAGGVSPLGAYNPYPDYNVSSNKSSTQEGKPQAVAALPQPSDSSGDSTLPARALQTAGDFDAVVYHAEMSKVALAVRMREVAAKAVQTADGSSGAAQVEAQQMTFDFYGEIRTQDLALFRQRTDAVAENLNGSQRQTYIEASRQVAARFKLSVTISGAALSGFSRASNQLKDGDPTAFNRFLGLVTDALGNTDDIVSQALSLLDAFFSGKGNSDAAFSKFINGLFGSEISGVKNAASPQPSSASLTPATNGSTAQFASANVQFEFSFSYESQTTVVQQSDPITLDLDGDGIELTHYNQGAQFDITGKNPAAKTAFVTGGDAFLALDRDNDGAITSGKELFGDQNGAANGYEELAKLDTNRDGFIDVRDKDFSKLLLFKDNGDGKTDKGDLITLADAGIVELNLQYANVGMKAAGGNHIAQTAAYRRADGTTGRTADVVLNYIA